MWKTVYTYEFYALCLKLIKLLNKNMWTKTPFRSTSANYKKNNFWQKSLFYNFLLRRHCRYGIYILNLAWKQPFWKFHIHFYIFSLTSLTTWKNLDHSTNKLGFAVKMAAQLQFKNRKSSESFLRSFLNILDQNKAVNDKSIRRSDITMKIYLVLLCKKI